jgi:hypothetical protein
LTPLAEKVRAILRRWRRRDERDDGPNIYGSGIINQAAGKPGKKLIHEALIELHARGDVDRLDCINGRYWRSSLPHRIDVR